MVTRSASPGRLGLEPAGQRLLLAVARLPYGATAFLANLQRCARSAAGRAAALFAVIAAAYVVGAELAWHHFSSGLAALPLLTEVGALGYLGVWWAGPCEATAVEREYLR